MTDPETHHNQEDVPDDEIPDPFSPSDDAVHCFRLWWQLENWLREMVYVELRAVSADWAELVRKAFNNPKWPPRSMQHDKTLQHMATRHESVMSYVSTGELRRLVAEHWRLFEHYFPPKSIFEARFDEIEQVRHRIAHFRGVDSRDLDRLVLFLRDIDNGVWRFCTSYYGSKTWIPETIVDPVSQYFIDTHANRHIVEMRAINSGYQYAQVDSLHPYLGFHLTYSVRPWAEGVWNKAGSLPDIEGVIYCAEFTPLLPNGNFLIQDILEQTVSCHKNCAHIRLTELRGLAAFVPAVLGQERVVQTIEAFLKACCTSVRRGDPWDERAEARRVERIVHAWPEYVLPPYHPLGLLTPDMPCRMFPYPDD